MRRILVSLALAAAAPLAGAQTLPETAPRGGKAIAGKGMIYMTKDGQVLDRDEMRAAIKMGVPVHIKLTRQGRKMIVERVIVDNE